MNKKIAVWLLLCGIWGSTWLFIKIGLQSLPPISFAGLRFSASALILWVIAWVQNRPLPVGRKHWEPIIWSGILGFAINYSLIFWGEQYISSGLAAVLQAMIPVFGLFIAHYFLETERITPSRLAGVFTGVVGVSLIFANQISLSGSKPILGSVALVVSAFVVACSNVIIKAKGRQVDPIVITAAQMTIGSLPLLLVGFKLEGSPLSFNWSARSLGALAYLVLIGGVIAFAAYYWLVRHMEVTQTMLVSLVTPIVAVMLGILVLGEELSWRTAVGAILIIGGVASVLAQKLILKAFGGREEEDEAFPANMNGNG